MARRKHAAALFEVFHDKKPIVRSVGGSWGSSWLFKGRTRSAESDEPTTVVDENDPTTMTIRSPLIAPRIAAVEAMPVAPPKPAPSPKPVEVPKAVSSAPAPSVARSDVRDEVAVLREKFASSSAPESGSDVPQLESATHFHFDRDAKEVTLRLPLNSAVIAASCFVLCVGIAYVAGRHIGNNEAAAAQFAKDTHLTELHTSALDLPRRANRVAPIPAAAKPAPRVYADDAVYHDRESAPMANSVHDITPIARPAADGPRIIGLNYVLIQVYPTQASAAEARDFLIKNGISCTVEKAPPGFALDPSWMGVITTRGFDKEQLHTPEYEAFRRQVEKAGDKFAQTGEFKRFSLHVYKLK
jgi:hypothetical protein